MKRSRLFEASLFLASLISGNALAQEVVQAKLAGSEFMETVSPTRQVSGATVIGVLSGAADVKQENFFLRLPSDAEERQVCLQLQSLDGAYFAENPYQLPEKMPVEATIALPYGGGEWSLLSELPPQGLTATAKPGACGGSNQAAYLPVAFEEVLAAARCACS